MKAATLKTRYSTLTIAPFETIIMTLTVSLS